MKYGRSNLGLNWTCVLAIFTFSKTGKIGSWGQPTVAETQSPFMKTSHFVLRQYFVSRFSMLDITNPFVWLNIFTKLIWIECVEFRLILLGIIDRNVHFISKHVDFKIKLGSRRCWWVKLTNSGLGKSPSSNTASNTKPTHFAKICLTSGIQVFPSPKW